MAKRRRKKRRKSLSWKGFLVLLVLFLTSLPFILSAGLKWWLNEDKLIELMEGSLNAKVAVESVDLHVLSFPPEIHLSQLTLTSKNGEQEPAITVEKGALAVELMPLIGRRLELRSIDIDGGQINYLIAENGSDNLTPLFNAPDNDDSTDDTTDTDIAPDSEQELNVQELKWGVGMRSINLKNLKISIRILAADLDITCHDFDLQARDIELDPRKLTTSNRAKIALQGKISVDSRSTPVTHYGTAAIDMDSTSRLFDPVSGDFDPEIQASIQLGEGSYLSTKIPTIQNWWAKLSALSRIGITIGQLPEKATFDQHPIDFNYSKDTLHLEEQLNLELADWQLALMPPSIFNIASTEHDIKAELRTSKIHGTLVIDLIETFIKKSPKFLRKILREELLEKRVRNGRLILKAKSEGTFDDPKVKLDSPLSDEKSLIDQAKNNAGDLLKELFD